MNASRSSGNTPALRSRSVNTRVASEILGVSESTVRRRFRSGHLSGKEVGRGQGTVILIELTDAMFSKWRESVAARPELPDEPKSDDMLDLDRAKAWAQTMVEPLVRALTDQQKQNADLSERIGILRARMDALTKEKAAQEAILNRLMQRDPS